MESRDKTKHQEHKCKTGRHWNRRQASNETLHLGSCVCLWSINVTLDLSPLSLTLIDWGRCHFAYIWCHNTKICRRNTYCIKSTWFFFPFFIYVYTYFYLQKQFYQSKAKFNFVRKKETNFAFFNVVLPSYNVFS